MKVGERVITRYGEQGVVKRMYDDFSACGASFVSMSGADWLEAQTIPFTDDQLKECWFSVSVDDGGAVLSPKSLLTLVREVGNEE
jgi:hypothetical protein